MKTWTFRWRWIGLLAAGLVALGYLVSGVFAPGPRHPVALIRVVDGSGKPIAGAVVRPDGLRGKLPNASGHFGWRAGGDWPTNAPVATDRDGCARVPYPKYIFERIETGQISFSVDHPDYVSDRPFRVVATTPPAGAPWSEWARYLWYRVRLKSLVARPDPVALQPGAALQVTARPGPAPFAPGRLFAQVVGLHSEAPDFWLRPGAASVLTGRLPPGAVTVRAVYLGTNGAAWFSDLVTADAAVGQTNEVMVDLRAGMAVRGRLDPAVPRPVLRGRVVAHVWPLGQKPQNSPPQWHAWTPVREDGSFELRALPAGDLEIVALCQGFVSTNGPGQFQGGMHYPQKYSLEGGDLEVVLGMTRTARLEVNVRDDRNRPLAGASVTTWPNVRYGEWSATILAGDCYNSADLLQYPGDERFRTWWREVPDFRGTSDASGVAVLSNLPVEVREISIEHAQFLLPAVPSGSGEKHRQMTVSLVPGQTNRLTAQLEPRGRTAISHY